jgi:FMN reductase
MPPPEASPGVRDVVVVTAGLGQPSATRLLADRLAAAVTERLEDAGVAPTTRVVELREHARDLTDHLLTGFPSPALRETIDAVTGADGVIAVSPIFSASYSGLFKLFWDVVERDGLAGMPVLLGATGGTARHSLALEHAMRPLFAYLNAAVVPTAVYAAAEDWGQREGGDAGLADRVDRAAREFASAVAARERPAADDPFEAPVPFETLLRSRPTR